MITRREYLQEPARSAYARIAEGVYPPIPDFGIVDSAEVVGGCLRIVKPFSLDDVAIDLWWDE